MVNSVCAVSRVVSVVLSPVHARLINEMTANQTTTVLLGDIRRGIKPVQRSMASPLAIKLQLSSCPFFCFTIAETAGHGSSNEPTKSSSPPKETATTATQSARSSDPDDRSAAKKRPAAAQRSALPRKYICLFPLKLICVNLSKFVLILDQFEWPPLLHDPPPQQQNPPPHHHHHRRRRHHPTPSRNNHHEAPSNIQK